MEENQEISQNQQNFAVSDLNLRNKEPSPSDISRCQLIERDPSEEKELNVTKFDHVVIICRMRPH
jgi:hypothetical protein